MKANSSFKMIVLTAVLLSLCGIQPATADSLSPGSTILVNTVEDEYDLIGSGTGCSLREAIQSANTDTAFGGCTAGTAGSDTITFVAGVNTFTLTIGTADPDPGNYAGDFNVTSDLIIQGNGQGVTIIDASTQTIDPSRILLIDDENTPSYRTVTIRDLTLTGGNENFDSGGAIKNRETLVLEDVTFMNNQTAGAGGGLLSSPAMSPGQTTTIRRCTFLGNHSSSRGGGAYIHDPAVIEDSDFEDNYTTSASEGSGGGVFLSHSYFSFTVSNSQFIDNTAELDGGNLYKSSNEVNATLVIENSNFSGGNADQGSGGGAYLDISYSPSMVVSISRTIFRDNDAELDGGNLYARADASGGSALVEVSIFTGGMTAAGDGGNIYAAEDDEEEPLHLTIRRSEISEGTAGYDTNAELGGGIFTAADLSLENVTISGNTAHTGGGIYTAGESSGSTFKNVTLVYNTHDGTYGAGIYKGNTGVIDFQNSIVAFNNQYSSCSGHTCDCYTGGADISTGNNLENGDSCGFNYSNTDPLLGPLGMHGGFSQTHELLSGSPAIDHGNNATCLADDQRGWYRPLDGDKNGTATCDIGAYEYSHLLGFLPLIKK